MSLVKSKDTKPEMLVRKLVHGLGYRYRLHDRTLPGAPDLVFKSRKKVIFVHGCFWHKHPDCKKNRTPKSRQDFWIPKLQKNRERDLDNQKQLLEYGWSFLVLWECELKDISTVRERVIDFLEN